MWLFRDLPVSRLACRSFGLSFGWSVGLLFDRPVIWSACLSVDLTITWPACQSACLPVVGLLVFLMVLLVSRFVSWSVCWLVCRLIHLSVGRPFGQSDCKSASVTVSQSFGQAGLICRLVTWPVGWSARPLWDDYFPEEQVTFTGVKG